MPMPNDELQTQWDARYAKNKDTPQACRVLREFSHLLPKSGQALDLACGMGGNALWLAEQGLTTSAWDLSPVGINKLEERAKQQMLSIDAKTRDIIAEPPAENSVDVIVVSYFLERALFPALLASLKPSGLLFYETFVQDKPQGVGPSNPDYLLKQNELLEISGDLIIRVYREEGLIGDITGGCRNIAMLIAQKQ